MTTTKKSTKPSEKRTAKPIENEPDKVKKGKEDLVKTLKESKKTGKKPSKEELEAQAQMAEILAVAETGYLAIAADGYIDDDELKNFSINFVHWMGGESAGITVEDIDQLLYIFGQNVRDWGIKGRLQSINARLDAESKRGAYQFACLLSLCDGDLNEDEMGVLDEIAESFELSRTDARTIFRDVKRAISA